MKMYKKRGIARPFWHKNGGNASQSPSKTPRRKAPVKELGSGVIKCLETSSNEYFYTTLYLIQYIQLSDRI